MSNLYEVLELCLQDMDAGTDLETVLFRYPELADELRPILEASVQARSLASGEPSPDLVRRNRAKLLQHAAQMREAHVPPARRLWAVSLRRALVSLAVIGVLLMSGTGLVRAAATTLPGDRLYPVKRSWENALVALTFDSGARQALEVEHRNNRLAEIHKIFAEGRAIRVDFAGRVTSQNGDVWLVSKIPVMISAQTVMPAQAIAAGTGVRVIGVTHRDGIVLAERIELLSYGMAFPDLDEDDDTPEIEQKPTEAAGNDREDSSGQGSEGEAPRVEKTNTPRPASSPEKISINGSVTSINGTILIVNAQPMDISTAEIKGTAKVGATVKAEGYFDANGVFIVTRIEFLSSGSNSGSSTNSNNDSGADDNDDHDGKDDNGGNDDNGNDDGDDD
jgi:hypothetical protein